VASGLTVMPPIVSTPRSQGQAPRL
jgi:hypothetical protein